MTSNQSVLKLGKTGVLVVMEIHTFCVSVGLYHSGQRFLGSLFLKLWFYAVRYVMMLRRCCCTQASPYLNCSWRPPQVWHPVMTNYFDPLWYGRLVLGMTRGLVNVQHMVYSNRDTR